MNWKFPGESFSPLKRNMYDGVGGIGATKSERILTEAVYIGGEKKIMH